MKNMKWFLLGVAALVALIACGQKKAAPKALVLYYSQTSNTKTVAEEIANKLGADIEEIVPVTPYDGDFQATIARSMQDREAGITPEIQPLKADLSAYETIFIGFPVWFGTYAPPIATLLDQVNLAGKKVVPFCTFGSGGLDSSVRDIRIKQPQADVLDGYGVRAARIDAVPKEVDQFLKANGFLEGEYVKLEAFPEEHPVSEEEAAIFQAAVSTYPMMANATAATVASRTIPNGIEYLFTAAEKPREDNPQMPPAGPMKVYVTVEDGQAPVFTQVVR